MKSSRQKLSAALFVRENLRGWRKLWIVEVEKRKKRSGGLLAGQAGCKDKQNEKLRVFVRKDCGKVRWCWSAEPERKGAPAKDSGVGIRCLLPAASCQLPANQDDCKKFSLVFLNFPNARCNFLDG